MSSLSAPQAVPSGAARKRKGKLKLWLLLGGGLLFVVLLVVAVKMRDRGPKPISVTTDKAVVQTITQVVTATGKVQPEVEVKISSEVPGELTEIPVEEGQRVKRGDVLAKIKQDYYKAVVDQQNAALMSARASSLLNKAQLAKAQDDFDQADQLYLKKLISDAAFTAAKTNLDVAKASYAASLAQIHGADGLLNQAKDQLNKTVIYSPMDGTISSLSSKVGERVLGTGQFAGTEIMRVADLTHMEVRVKVNENDIVNVKVGDRAVISIDAFPDRKFEGRVYEISASALSSGGAGSNAAEQAASASDEVTNFLVKIRIIDAHTAPLRPGMSATADIQTQTVNNVVAVPIQAVTVRDVAGKTSDEIQKEREKKERERSGNELTVTAERRDARRDLEQLRRVVFVRQGDHVVMRDVVTGIADNDVIEIKKGLKPGEEVVTGTYAAISRMLKDGSKIIVEKSKSPDKF